MPNLAKKRIETIVRGYTQQYPEEFAIVKDAIAMKRSLTTDEFATLEGSKESRALYEIPERLSTMLLLTLEEEEMTWLRTKPGAHWFARKFPVFTLPSKI